VLESLPKTLDYVVCGPTAAKFLGLTSVMSKIYIYTEKPYNLDKEVKAIVVDDLKSIPYQGKKLKRTTPEKTISDILKWQMEMDAQIPVEALAMYFIDCDEGKKTRIDLEIFLREEGVYDLYLELKETAEEWAEYGS